MWIGVWENQNGSRLLIDRIDGAYFYGTFESRKGRAVAGRSYAVQGTVNEQLVGFMVNFGEVGSLANFSGRLSEDGVLHTLWVLTRMYADEARLKQTEPWNSFIVNSDQFRKLT